MARYKAFRPSTKRIIQLIVLICVVTFGAWFILLSEEHNADSNKSFFSNRDMASRIDRPFHEGCVDTEAYLQDDSYVKQNATFLMLTRNEDLDGVVASIMSLERRFNQWFQYPYVFLNNQPFTEQFQERIRSLTTADVTFAQVKDSVWNFPNEKDLEFKHYIESQGDRGIMYGNLPSYHKMCRFYSGLFYKHEAVQKYEWYWRIEPDVEFFCDITYDPFFEMQKSGKKYGFTIVIKELYWTVPNLFRATQAFVKQNNLKPGSLWKVFTKSYKVLDGDEHLNNFVNHEHEMNAEVSHEFLIEHLGAKWKKGQAASDELIEEVAHRSTRKVPIVEDKFYDEEYNWCHFWSNFEIARVDVFDNELYNKYFQYLENWGGFWRERWGDAPVHSLGLALSLDVKDIHYFRDIGYQHSTIGHCPVNKKDKQLPYHEQQQYTKIFQRETLRMSFRERAMRLFKSDQISASKDTGSGCRCQCPNIPEVEDSSKCPYHWFEMAMEVADTHLPLNATQVMAEVAEDYRKEHEKN